ncbi:4-alpha-glucanotransferase [Caulobacter sp. D4A]|uniref:4-alpha-glucanotransferase n=1 Tax=Caulobacter sp. D4A TaxID=2204171 RepID=UPI000D72D100|nr:4-alpha-glucanotransferase [Caulobacter sp. D4A]PXA95717.1 4-alpha-glucanotransferase [Caulobacter sp. D4A]
MSREPLLALAQAVGVLVDWTDFNGVERQVGRATIEAVLAALGHDPKAPQETLARLGRRGRGGLMIVQAGAPFSVASASGHARLTLENGQTLDLAASDGQISVTIETPGYHWLDVDEQRLSLAVCPARCLTPRDLLGRPGWGLGVQLYALSDSGAFGDFSSLAAFAKAAGAAGADALAISPTNALFPAAPQRCSPYSPSSRDRLNIMFADPSSIGGTAPAATGEALIDWSASAAAKLARLNAAYHVFAGDPRLDDFIAAGGQALRRHALFEALDERFAPTFGAGNWRAWPAPFRSPQSAEREADALGLGDRIGFFLFAQWLADLGLAQSQAAAKAAGLGLGLITDLAVGLDPGGAHAWSRPQDLMMGLTLGAPPDAFQAAGQAWGITSFAPDALIEGSYEPFLTTLRAALGHAGGVRIDHALGLGRLWVVPDGGGADQGAYLRYPIDDLLSLIALESHRAGAVVIGEDLGVVPPGFRERLAERGLLGMRVLPFERDTDGGFRPPGEWDSLAVAMTSTHDLAPVAGWWRGRDIDWRRRLDAPGDRDAETLERAAERQAFWQAADHAGLTRAPPTATAAPQAADAADAAVDLALELVAATPCELALIPIEDLAGLDEAPNLPGVVDLHPNWRRRLPQPSPALLASPQVAARLERLRAQRPR